MKRAFSLVPGVLCLCGIAMCMNGCGGGDAAAGMDVGAKEAVAGEGIVDSTEEAGSDATAKDVPDVTKTDPGAIADVEIVMPDDAPEYGGGEEDMMEDVADDVHADLGAEVTAPTCLDPVLPDSCLKEALACTGLTTCGPTVTKCFQYDSPLFPQSSWMVWDYFRYFNWTGGQLSIGGAQAMRVEFSNGAWMIADFAEHPRAVYSSPEGKVCATLGFDITDNSGNWKDSYTARKAYLRYGADRPVIISPRFEASPRSWWKIEGYDVRCPDGSVENYSIEEFNPLAYLLFGGENRSGKSFLPIWTSHGCELGPFTQECIYQEDVKKAEWCEGAKLHVCRRGVALDLDCSALSKTCVQIPLKYGSKIWYQHAFCTDGSSCSEDFCDGTMMGECWGGYAEYKDCAEIGGTCTVLPGSPPYTQTHVACVQGSAKDPAKECSPQGFAEYCDGNTTVRCDYKGSEQRFDCSTLGLTCVQYVTEGGDTWSSCHPPDELESCGAGYEEGCTGDTRRICHAGRVLFEDCMKRYGETCRVGSTGEALCVDEASVPCTNTAINCVGCDGDRRVWCGEGGLTIFDDCSMQGLALTGGNGRTCYVGTGVEDISHCPVCGQKGAATCDLDAFTPYCADHDMVKCFGDHAIEFDCIEVFPQYASGWCNIDKWGNAYCESVDAPPCDPEATPSVCEVSPPKAVNCTEAGVLEKTNCLDQGLAECRTNSDGDAVCVQSGAEACDAATFKPKCDGASLVHCVDGFTFGQFCGMGMECGANQQGDAVCHQAGAEWCEEFLFEPKCEGNIAVSCEQGFVNQIDCPAACQECICQFDGYQVWCEAGFSGS
ncbi:MAG: hypothetical protein GXP54_13085 [Deltaproteobacteria bacterium]|nr:hypothetical protein [Deltaproteobacteria bacterium]